MNLSHLLHRAAALHGGRVCIASGTRGKYTYGEVSILVSRIARGLLDRLHLEAGARVALFMPNSCEYLLLLFATWHAGLTAVPINSKLHPKELAWILENCAANVLFTTPSLGSAVAQAVGSNSALDEVIEIPSPVWDTLLRCESCEVSHHDGHDLAWLFYTSGTTGRPKGAMLSHANLLAMTISYFADVDTVCAADSMLHCAPLSHGSGLYALPHVARGAAHVIPESGGFDAGETLELIANWPNCSFFFAPTMVRRLVDAMAADGGKRENIKTIVYGGGPMYVADLLRAMEVVGPQFAQIYGQGEAPMTITSLSKELHNDATQLDYLQRLASVGLPRTDVEVLTVGADDQPLPAGAVGEIVVRGSVVMQGYWQDAEATTKALRNGWLHTGDLGSFDQHGFLTLAGRSKEVIISGGSNIYPREVEDVLVSHDDVLEAAVVGRRHPQWGEEVVAFVVYHPGSVPDQSKLDQWCLENLARYKRPRRYLFVADLPKNNYGKVAKTMLQALAEADTSSGAGES